MSELKAENESAADASARTADDAVLRKVAAICGGGVLAVLVIVWAVLTFVVYPGGVGADPPAARGQFGDMFGLANALFSGLAFSALIVSLGLQRKELALQRAELALTRSEVAKQAIALTAQAGTMERQAQTELLAARIVGVGALMKLGQEASGSNLAAHLGHFGYASTEILKDNTAELVKLLKEAEQLQAEKKQANSS